MAFLSANTNGLGFELAPQTTNSGPGNAFVIIANHNVEFQYDLSTTNGIGTSNVVFTFDTALDNISAPSSWKLSSYTISSAVPSGSATSTYSVQMSNLPAFYMRLAGVGSSATNHIMVTNVLYYPYP
jgi:hypothetical protein